MKLNLIKIKIAGMRTLKEIQLAVCSMMMMMNCFCGMVDQRLAFFPARTVVRDPRHHESLTRREQNLSRT